MSAILFGVQIILVVIIVILVLLQKSSSMGLGAYSSSNDSVFGAGGPMNFLTKATIIVGILFIINTLTLVSIYNNQATNSSAWDKAKTEQTEKLPQLPSNPVDNRN
ncbi:MAG: preprotein translocase subunit SecG [Epsilonproteobacteria bacterium]|jgi:preprotein translocase subunit SecG|nr:preprotein translocase subunit SecG [Campylobacterota bacterium]NPA88868.1 preprotein translocase subunit SecG [Campylobacterota bacterium]